MEAASSDQKKFKKTIDMIGAQVRGVGKYEGLKSGFVKSLRTLKQEKNKVLFTVKFPDADGGSRTVDDMTTEEVVMCYKEQARFEKMI